MGESKRNHLIDLIKGTLIILVMIGHFLPRTLSENPERYIIYSFHMPAFFYISGILYSGRASLKDYGLRLGVPWLLAVQLYYVLLNNKALSVTSYLKSYIAPYYHLWFVVGFFFCIIVVKLCKENKWLLLCIGTILAFLSSVLKGNEFVIWKVINHTIRPQYLLFFTMGLLAKADAGGYAKELLLLLPYLYYSYQLDSKCKMLGGNRWLDICCYAESSTI